jgi:hypothetical protein
MALFTHTADEALLGNMRKKRRRKTMADNAGKAPPCEASVQKLAL